MILQAFGKVFVLILFAFIPHISGTSECMVKNTTCTDIHVAEGFRFKHDCPEGSEISVEGNNKTNLGYADLSTQSYNHVLPIVKMDNHSVITGNCQDLTITCTTLTGGNKVLVEEKCAKFKTISDDSVPPSPIHQKHPGWITAVVIIAVFIGCFAISYCCWKKETWTQLNATYFRYVRTCFWTREGNQEGNRFPMGGTQDLEEQNFREIRNGEDPRGSGENDQHTLECVISGEMGAPNTTTPSDYSAMNGFRNMRKDPGVRNGIKGREIQRELDGGGPTAHYLAEEQPLLPDQRVASGSLGMLGEAVALVNELSFDQDRVSRCSAAPDTDVESTHPGKPTNEL